MNVEQEAVAGLRNGHTIVGIAAVRLTADRVGKAKKGIYFQCPGDDDPNPNSVNVYVGAKGVTAGATETGGVLIRPGDWLFLPVEQPDEVWLVAPSNNQDVAWLIL